MLEDFGYDGDDKSSDNSYNDNYTDNYISNKIIIVMTPIAVVGNGGLLVVMQMVFFVMVVVVLVLVLKWLWQWPISNAGSIKKTIFLDQIRLKYFVLIDTT